MSTPDEVFYNATRGIKQKLGNSSMTQKTYLYLACSCILTGVIGGVFAGSQPDGAGWRFFSYHPLLMMLGFVAAIGNAALLKKIGGYNNTKYHGYLSWFGMMMAGGGYYVIWKNKELAGKEHLTSYHSMTGFVCLLGLTTVGMFGGVFLHPDFGLAKTDRNVRKAHKRGARLLILLAWITCFTGLKQLTSDPFHLMVVGLPLGLLAPYVILKD